jgi:putative flippase GtrA
MAALRFPLVAQVLRFMAVGTLNTLLGLTVIYGLVYFADVNPFLANAMGYAAGLAVSYGLNKNWSFEGSRAAPQPLLRFLLVTSVSYLVNILVLSILLTQLHTSVYVAQVIALLSYTAMFFVGCRLFVFLPAEATAHKIPEKTEAP